MKQIGPGVGVSFKWETPTLCQNRTIWQYNKKLGYHRESVHLTSLYRTAQKACRYVECDRQKDGRANEPISSKSSVQSNFQTRNAPTQIIEHNSWLETEVVSVYTYMNDYFMAFLSFRKRAVRFRVVSKISHF